MNPEAAVRACFQAYAEGDLDTLERLIAPTFCFTSPMDNGLDRQTYFERCWPAHQVFQDFQVLRTVASAPDESGRVTVFATYEARKTTGERFCNTEVFTVRDGQLLSVEVFFGWEIPHPAPAGGFKDPVSLTGPRPSPI